MLSYQGSYERLRASPLNSGECAAVFAHVPLPVPRGENTVIYDLLVKNGLVANEYTVLPLDVAVQPGKDVGLASHGGLDGSGAQHVIESNGKYVLPGGI